MTAYVERDEPVRYNRVVIILVGIAALTVSVVLAHKNSLPVQLWNRNSLQLTNAERAWLASHKTITVAFDGYFPPYSFLNDSNVFEGLAVDIFKILGQRLDITIEPSPYTVWKKLYAAAKRREVDVVATMGHRPDREEWFAFTRPYIFKSLVIMTGREMTAIKKPEDLAGKRVAMVKSYQYVKPLLKKYPTIIPYYVNTMLDGLNAVAVGRADAAITFLGAGHYLQAKYQITDLKFAAVLARDRFSESIGVRRDWPELATILDKALASISESEMMALSRHWIGPEPEPGIAPRKVLLYLVIILGCVFFIVAGFILWNRTLRKQVRRKTYELQQELGARREAVERLQESEERFRTIFNAANDAFFIHDAETGAILNVNQKTCEMFGLSRQEVLHSSVEDLSAGVPPYTQKEAAAWMRQATSGTPQLFEWRARHADGHLFWVEVNMRNAVIGSGKCIIVTSRDISERKKAEEELRALNTDLDQRVRRRTAEIETKSHELEKSKQALQYLLEDMNEAKQELEVANRQLKKLDQLKSMFIASMSHELRTPLNSIIGFSSILLEEWIGPLTEEQKKNLAIILRAGKHLLALINDVIDISKVEAGSLEIVKDAFDIQELVDEAVASLRDEIAGKGLELSVENVSVMMQSDRRRLLQCLLNLLSNAVKFTDKGSILVSVKKISAERVALQVTDTGIGISQEDGATLFQPFVRLHGTGTANYPGTGLGLYLTKKLANEILAGELSMRSTPGEGSTFTLNIPIEVKT